MKKDGKLASKNSYTLVCLGMRKPQYPLYSESLCRCADCNPVLIGKILQDANTVASYNIEEKGFIVCMTSKVSIKLHDIA